MRLPVCWKLRNGTNKYLLRKLAYRYVPQSILDRPKQGFVVPVERWLRGPLKEWAEQILFDNKAFENLPLNRKGVHSLWQLHQTGKRNAAPLLWAILMLLQFRGEQY